MPVDQVRLVDGHPPRDLVFQMGGYRGSGDVAHHLTAVFLPALHRNVYLASRWSPIGDLQMGQALLYHRLWDVPYQISDRNGKSGIFPPAATDLDGDVRDDLAEVAQFGPVEEVEEVVLVMVEHRQPLGGPRHGHVQLVGTDVGIVVPLVVLEIGIVEVENQDHLPLQSLDLVEGREYELVADHLVVQPLLVGYGHVDGYAVVGDLVGQLPGWTPVAPDRRSDDEDVARGIPDIQVMLQFPVRPGSLPLALAFCVAEHVANDVPGQVLVWFRGNDPAFAQHALVDEIRHRTGDPETLG